MQAPLELSARNNRVLVIDDNPAIHEDFAKILAGTDDSYRQTIEYHREARSRTFGRLKGRPEELRFPRKVQIRIRRAWEYLAANSIECIALAYARAFASCRRRLSLHQLRISPLLTRRLLHLAAGA